MALIDLRPLPGTRAVVSRSCAAAGSLAGSSSSSSSSSSSRTRPCGGAAGLLLCSRDLPAAAVSPRGRGQRDRAGAAVGALPEQAAAVLAGPGTIFHYTQLEIQTAPGTGLFDITPQIRDAVEAAGLEEGFVNVLSRHTTTAVTINENESRLIDDVRQFLHRLAPPADPYLHNDLHVRPAPDGWPGGHAAWVLQEPRNAHSHLLSMVLGNTQTVPVTKAKLALGVWQSVLLVELDGPRLRTVGVQLVGRPRGAAGAAKQP